MELEYCPLSKLDDTLRLTEMKEKIVGILIWQKNRSRVDWKKVGFGKGCARGQE